MASVLGYRLILSPSHRQILLNRNFWTHCSVVVILFVNNHSENQDEILFICWRDAQLTADTVKQAKICAEIKEEEYITHISHIKDKHNICTLNRVL